jgi:murein DD-endopeptidase MepM/ murein hydrolase activator NlpD
MIRKILPVVVSISLLLGIAVTSSAASISDMQKDLQQAQSEKKAITKAKNAAKKTLLNDQNLRNSIIADLEKKGYQKSQIEAKLKDIEAAIKTLDSAIAQAQSEYDAQLKLFQDRIVVLYVQSRTKADSEELLQSTDFDQMFKKVHMLQLVSKFDQDLMTNLEKKQAEIDGLKASKQKEEENAQQQLEESLKAINGLEASRAAADDRVEKSKQDIAQLEKSEDALEKEAQELGALIRKASSSGTKYSGIMQWPLPGYYRIGSGFGYRMHPILHYKKFHGGIDIGAPMGTPIHAAASGTIIWAGWRSGGSGNTVIIDHGGGISTLYLHIKSGGILVREGQKVNAGDIIARVGSTGLSTGPHLHFEVRKNGERQNPLNYVSNK